MLLVCGNTKLGDGLIWGFSTPAKETCPGATETCLANCYALRLEKTREKVLAAHQRNWEASRRLDFVKRIVAEIIAHEIKVVRISTFGDIYSVGYARKWLTIARTCKTTRFYLYSRSWCVPAIAKVLAQLARLKNVRVWFSADRDSYPTEVPKGVRVAYLQVADTDLPPSRPGLVFRVRRLRSKRVKKVSLGMVCPPENGVPQTKKMTCEECGYCWRK